MGSPRLRDGKRDGRFLTNYACVAHVLPALLPLFRWLRLLNNVDVCHKETFCKGSDPVEAAVKKHRGLRSETVGVEPPTPTARTIICS